MRIVQQDVFINYTTDLGVHLTKAGLFKEIWELERFQEEVTEAKQMIKVFLVEVIGGDLKYELFDNKTKDYIEKNKCLLVGLAFLMFILLRAEMNNVSFDRNGFYKSSFGGFKREYLSLNQLEEVWNKSKSDQNFVFNRFMEGLYMCYAHSA